MSFRLVRKLPVILLLWVATTGGAMAEVAISRTSPTAGGAMAENAGSATAPDRAADMAMIRTKAAAIPGMGDVLDQLQSMIGRNSGPMSDLQNVQIFLGNVAGVRDFRRLPVNIVAVTQIPLAQRRAQILAEVMTADLDGDWAVTRDELRSSLGSGQTQRAAEMFIAGDTDMDNILTTDEIKAIISRTAAAEVGQRGESRNLLGVFDFDGDGTFTQEEFNRAMAALKG